MDLTDKPAFVAEGTRDIGPATVAAFLAAGAWVAVNGRTEQSTGAARPCAEGAAGDIGRAEDCRRIVQRAVAAMGGSALLVNNAAIGGPFEKITLGHWDRTMNANLRGTFLCTEAAVSNLHQSKGSIVTVASVWIALDQRQGAIDVHLRGMFLRTRAAASSLRQSKVSIVKVASVSGLRGHGTGSPDYCASKDGVVNLTRDLVIGLGPDLRVDCLCPGPIAIDMPLVESDVADMASLVNGTPHVADAAFSIGI
jgi:NAD(P)-dependent dehydrogenase (short-subunit alcohol dehydrogenase family)